MLDQVQVEFGKVKWFDRRKMFGFIVPEEGLDVFFHVSALRFVEEGKDGFPCFNERSYPDADYAPREKDAVVFVRQMTFRGPTAAKVGSASLWNRMMENVPRVPVKEAAAQIARGWGAALTIV